MSEYLRSGEFSPAVYTLKTGLEVIYDPEKCLPPDIVSERMGAEAADMLEAVDLLYDGEPRPLRLLELGTGSGISLTSCANKLASLQVDSPIECVGLDIDTAAVQYTRNNLRMFEGNPADNFNVAIEQGNWNEDAVWQKLHCLGADNTGTPPGFDCILFNPPYFRDSDMIAQGYELSPRETMYGADADGLGHYRNVMPRITASLSEREGAGAIVRYPFSQSSERRDDITAIIYDAMNEHPGVAWCAVLGVISWAGSRPCSTMTIARSKRGVPAHMDPVVQLRL